MSQYWKNREAEALKQNKLTEKQYKAEVEKIYNCMLRDIQNEIDAFYGRYAAKDGITTIAEAKKRVSKLDMDDYERKAKQYVKDRDFSDLANDEMRLYNLTMKVNRLEMLKSRIGLELLAGHDDLEKFMKGVLEGRTMEELERQAGILGESIIKSKDLEKMVSSIVNASFRNATFSQRIWANEAVMKAELDKLLKQGLIQGKGVRDLARSLRTLCGASQRNAERLMITELARVQIEAQKLSYLENDFEEYEYIAEPTACPICKVLDGKHFKVAKMLSGENAAPMHPHCRCSTAPYSDRKEFDEWLNYLENGGTTEQWYRLRDSEEERSKPKHKYPNTVVDTPKIVSAGFRKRFDGISDNAKVNRAIYNKAKEILQHRSGTKYEDLAFIDAESGKVVINKSFDKENHAKPNKPMEQLLSAAKPYTIIGLHNHPSSSVPSMPDILACINRKYKFGIVICHNGKIYKYTVDKENFNKQNASFALDRIEKKGYNDKTRKMLLDAGVKLELI